MLIAFRYLTAPNYYPTRVRPSGGGGELTGGGERTRREESWQEEGPGGIEKPEREREEGQSDRLSVCPFRASESKIYLTAVTHIKDSRLRPNMS